MSRQDGGFTIIELMAVIAIVSILSATSVYMYGEYRERATGSEAQLMLKNILDAQIIYFLEKDDFYPNVAGSSISIPGAANPTSDTLTKIQGVKDTLKLEIPVGHNLDYIFLNNIGGNPPRFQLFIIAPFKMFPDNTSQLWGTLTTDGQIIIERTG